MSRKIGLGLPDRRVGLIPDSDVTEAELAAVKKRVTDTEAEVSQLKSGKVDKDTPNIITADHEVQVGSGFKFSDVDTALSQYVAYSTDPDERPDAPLVIFVTVTEPTVAQANDIWIEVLS